MASLPTALFVLVACGLAAQWLAVRGYLRTIRSAARLRSRNQNVWPHAALLFSVRGDGRGLSDRLEQCLSLDYPGFEIHVVVDHETDPSYTVARDWAHGREAPRAFVHLLQEISPSCSLKCSAVRQCLERLGGAVEVAVVVDVDSRIYPLWLKDLVGGLNEYGAGIVSGNRWYDPTTAGWGSLVRFIYNAHAVVPMQAMKMAWGGSLAMHRDVYASPVIPELLWKSPTEDSAMHRIAEAVGTPFAMDPHVMLLGRDSVSLPGCFDFIKRQLLWTRLYHERWWLIFFGLLASYAVLASQTLCAAWMLWAGKPAVAAVFAAGPIAAIVANVAIVESLHRSVSAVIKTFQGADVPPITWSIRAALVVWMPLAFATIVLAASSAAVARRVRWSGVDYRVLAPDGLRLVAYRPVQDFPAFG